MALEPGTRLKGRYEIQRILKRGGMGSVYAAHDRNLGTPCAVKEMLDIVAQSPKREYVRRKFGEEARILSRLKHPGIPSVRDFFDEGDTCYIVMDLVHGANLELELADCLTLTGAPFEPKVLVRDILQVLDVLVYLHGLDPPVVHRDIKPSNLVREFKTARIRVVDFGLAVVADAARAQTVVGTQDYCPVEQLRGQAQPRSDLYALGVSMHKLLTNRLPADGGDTSRIDPNLMAIIHQAIAPEPINRFRSAVEMKQALLRWEAGLAPELPTVNLAPPESVDLEPPPAPPVSPEPSPARLAPSLVLAGAFLACLGLGVGLGFGLRLGARQPAPLASPIIESTVQPLDVSVAPVQAAPSPLPAQRLTPVPPPPVQAPRPRPRPVAKPAGPPRSSAGLPAPSYPTHHPQSRPDPSPTRAEPEPAAVADPATPAPTPTPTPASPRPDQMPRSLREKLARLQTVMQVSAQQGQDLSPVVAPAMERFQPLLNAGRFAEAEKVVDGALEAVRTHAGLSLPESR